MPWILALSTGLLLVLSFPPFGFWPLAFVALAPLLSAVLKARDARHAANLGAVAGLSFYPLSLPWMWGLFGPASVAFWCIFSLWIALFALLFRALHLRWGASLLTVLASAAVWTGLEYFRAEVWFLNNTWLSLGFSQAANLPLLQTASLIGVYGLSFLIVAITAALVLRPAWAVKGLVALALMAVWGAWRLKHHEVLEGPPLSVALVQDESGLALQKVERSKEARQADLVLIPEDAYRFFPGREQDLIRVQQRALKGSQALTVLGAYACPEDLGKDGIWLNQAWLLGPDGARLGTYDKHHPIPFVERYLPANRDPRPLPSALGSLGVQICYDFDFEDGARKVVRLGAEVLLVPDFDPMEWGERQHIQHSAMAPLRAVENDRWTARAASSGISQVIDPCGRVVASLGVGESGILLGELRRRSTVTLYQRLGHWVGPLSLGVAVLLAAFLFLRRRRV